MAVTPLATAQATALSVRRTDYITPQDFVNTATGVAWGDLIPNGTAPEESQALVNAIRRACSLLDRFCHQVLACTVETDALSVFVRGSGLVRISTRCKWPQEVLAFSSGWAPSTVAYNVSTFPAIWIDGETVVAPVPWGARQRVPCTLTYTAGFPHAALLPGTYPAGSVTLPVSDVTGMATWAVTRGNPLVAYDDVSTEVLTVTAVTPDTPGPGGTLTVVPTTSAHNAGILISAIPEDIRLAAILTAGAVIRTRGSAAVAMSSMGTTATRRVPAEAGGLADIIQAKTILLEGSYVVPLWQS